MNMAYKKQTKIRDINKAMHQNKQKKEKINTPTKPIGTGHNWLRKQAKFEHKVRAKKEKERKILEKQQKKKEELRLKTLARKGDYVVQSFDTEIKAIEFMKTLPQTADAEIQQSRMDESWNVGYWKIKEQIPESISNINEDGKIIISKHTTLKDI